MFENLKSTVKGELIDQYHFFVTLSHAFPLEHKLLNLFFLL